MIQFTREQRERIDRLLAEGEEEQRKNGNITYTHEEICKILGIPNRERKLSR